MSSSCETVCAVTSFFASIWRGRCPQDDAWLQIGQEVVLVGDVARAYLESDSLTVNKAELAA
ncbi:MAG: hypothetical protein QNJ46_32245 [Leptolyngbyaceae cyanobacterium MO_188.B28]|nr:hypothetical protein [Leptolyngbyaceae cyanobacterium MO_188.B28]